MITTLAEMVIKSSVVLSCSFAATLVLRRQSAALRHMVWSVGLISALALPVFTAVVPAWYLEPFRVSQPSVSVIAQPIGATAGKSAVLVPEAMTPPTSSRVSPQRAGFLHLAGRITVEG